MRRAWQVFLFYLMLVWLGGMLLGGNLLCLAFVPLPARWRQPLVQLLISATVRVFLWGCALCGLMRLDLRALDVLNREQAGLLLAPNHPSMIDVFLVLSRVRHAVCLMKATIGSNAFLAAGAWLAGYISNRRVDLMMREAASAVRQGKKLLVFPEGTRTVVQPMNALKPGVGLLAKLTQAPVQVIVIRTNSAYLAKGWPIWRAPQFPIYYQATLGARVAAGESVDAVMQRLRAQYAADLPGPSIDAAFRCHGFA